MSIEFDPRQRWVHKLVKNIFLSYYLKLEPVEYFDISIVAEAFVSGSPPNQPIFLSENNKFHYLLILMIDGLFFLYACKGEHLKCNSMRVLGLSLRTFFGLLSPSPNQPQNYKYLHYISPKIYK